VVVNGRYSPELSRVSGLPRGVTAGSLGTAINGELQADREIVQRYVGQLADFNTRAFAALNTAFLEDGGYVHVPDGLILEDPIQILFVPPARPRRRPRATHDA
jgi:Fe-S cluster assembly protein SufD